MELIALTTKLSTSNFIGTGEGTKVTILSREDFIKEINVSTFRGVYVSDNDNEEQLKFLSESLDKPIYDSLVVLERVFNWTKTYAALYYIEYIDVPDSINPPAYMKIERLDNTLKIEG